ncbi:MAG: hypothetical protein ACMXYG_06180 [Candidatus Woesearchaeota archaeon]
MKKVNGFVNSAKKYLVIGLATLLPSLTNADMGEAIRSNKPGQYQAAVTHIKTSSGVERTVIAPTLKIKGDITDKLMYYVAGQVPYVSVGGTATSNNGTGDLYLEAGASTQHVTDNSLTDVMLLLTGVLPTGEITGNQKQLGGYLLSTTRAGKKMIDAGVGYNHVESGNDQLIARFTPSYQIAENQSGRIRLGLENVAISDTDSTAISVRPIARYDTKDGIQYVLRPGVTYKDGERQNWDVTFTIRVPMK